MVIWKRGRGSFGSGTAVDAPGGRMKLARLNNNKRKTQINMPYSGLQITGRKEIEKLLRYHPWLSVRGQRRNPLTNE